MTVVVSEMARDAEGRFRFQGRATLGEGTRIVLGIDGKREEAERIARDKAERAELHLAAKESHDPEDLPDGAVPSSGTQTLRAPDGTIVEATEATVAALLSVGYMEADGIPQRTNETAGPVGVQRRRPGRPRKSEAPVAEPPDEME